MSIWRSQGVTHPGPQIEHPLLTSFCAHLMTANKPMIVASILSEGFPSICNLRYAQ